MKKKLPLLLTMFFALGLYAQVPNGGFENWSNDSNGVLNPDGWETGNSIGDTPILRHPVSCTGMYSLRSRVMTFSGFNIPGYANVRFAFNQRPTSLSACIKSTVATGDQSILMYGAQFGDSIVAATGNCTFKIDVTTTGFVNYTFPITYISSLNPDTAMIIIVSGNLTAAKFGTEIIVDNLALGYSSSNGDTRFIPLNLILGQNKPNPAAGMTIIPLTLYSSNDINIQLYNHLGQVAATFSFGQMGPGTHQIELDLRDLPAGMYYYCLSGQGITKAKTLLIQH